MYRNKIGVDEQNYMTEKEFDNFSNFITDIEDKYYKKLIAKATANDLAIWLKYNRSEHNLDNAIERGILGFPIKIKDFEIIKKEVRQILEVDYQIKVIQETPLLLESSIPFDKIYTKGISDE